MSKTASKLRRLLYWLIALGALAISIAYALRPVPVWVDTAVLSRAPMRVTVDEDGITRIRERYVVSTPLTGRLLRITLDVGDDVRANQTILARMEPTDPTLLDPREVARARARVRAAERKLELAKAELAKSEAELNYAESEMGRIRRLLETDAASETEFATMELRFRQAAEETRSAGFAVDIAEYELQLEKAALLLTDPAAAADDAPDDAPDAPDEAPVTEMELTIKAPIDGRVLRIYQESTAVVTAGSPLMEIGDPTDLEVVADVLSRDAVRIDPGADVRLEHWGGNQPLGGRVRLVEPSGFTKLSALGVEEQRVNVIIDLLEPPEQRPALGDGFRVDCQITVWQGDNVLRVPTSALFRVDDQWTVFSVRDSVAREVPVEVGQSNDRDAQLVGGLPEGTRVILHPGDELREGVRVRER